MSYLWTLLSKSTAFTQTLSLYLLCALRSLIWKDIVLTAAHCSGNVWKRNAIIGGQEYNQVTGDAEKISIRRSVTHPKYDAATIQNDFQVVALDDESTKVAISDFAKPYAGAELTGGATLTVVGFGATNIGGNS